MNCTSWSAVFNMWPVHFDQCLQIALTSPRCLTALRPVSNYFFPLRVERTKSVTTLNTEHASLFLKSSDPTLGFTKYKSSQRHLLAVVCMAKSASNFCSWSGRRIGEQKTSSVKASQHVMYSKLDLLKSMKRWRAGRGSFNPNSELKRRPSSLQVGFCHKHFNPFRLPRWASWG